MQDQRVESLRNRLNERQIDALLISNFYNILHLTGFRTLTTDEREAFVLVTQDNIYLFTDERYLNTKSNIKNQISKIEIRLIELKKGLLTHLQEIVQRENIKTLGFEADDITYFEHIHIVRKFPHIKLIPTDRVILRLREIKDQSEIELIEKACEITDTCLRDIAPLIKLGMSEKEIAFKIEFWLKEKGYESAFDPIVGMNRNSAVPHYATKSGVGAVEKSSIILIDFGVKYKNYLSDITRMVFFGKPSDEVRKVYEVLLNAQEKTVEKVADFESLKDVDNFCRKPITEHGLPNYPHSTGHGVGLEIHEYPKVSFNSEDRIQGNQVFTIEPGVYFTGEYGMRIEDTVVIDKSLKAKVLTKFPKKLLVI